jgi:hypothetical protein
MKLTREVVLEELRAVDGPMTVHTICHRLRARGVSFEGERSGRIHELLRQLLTRRLARNVGTSSLGRWEALDVTAPEDDVPVAGGRPGAITKLSSEALSAELSRRGYVVYFPDGGGTP